MTHIIKMEPLKRKIDFQYLREKGLLLYEYVRGSKLYGLDRPESDEDHGGVYIEPHDTLLGHGLEFPEDVHDATNDDSWFSLRKFMDLLIKSNPNVLESLYVPEDKILYKHPVMDIILSKRDQFVTKKCFGSFMGYAKTQIEKAQNLKKKIVHPIEGPQQSVLEFIMYEKEGGSDTVVNWLKNHGLLQKYCGLVNLDKMICCYDMYYDFPAHLYFEYNIRCFEDLKKFCTEDFDKKVEDDFSNPFLKSLFHYGMEKGYSLLGYDPYGSIICWDEVEKFWDDVEQPFGYKGLVNEKDTSNQVRLSSIPKGEKAVLLVSYNKDAYSTYCQQYKEYHDWNKHHNEERFNLAKKGHYDLKNGMHSARLLAMGIEIARGEGVKIDRRGIDRDWLLQIRNGDIVYEDLMKYLTSRDQEMKDAMASSKLPDEIDLDFVDNLIREVRKEFYGLGWKSWINKKCTSLGLKRMF